MNQELQFQRVALLFPAVPLPLLLFRAFARHFAHVHDDRCEHRIGILQGLLARQGEPTALQQGFFHPDHGSPNRGLMDFPILTQMEVRSVFPPEFQCQQELRAH